MTEEDGAYRKVCRAVAMILRVSFYMIDAVQRKRLLCLALLVVLAGCATTPTVSDPLSIVAFGDSTTAPRSTVDEVYAVRLEALLADQGVEARVINSGVGGSHTGRLEDNARHKKRHALDRFDEAVLGHNPDFVVIQFGWNDSYVDSDDEHGPSRIPLEAYARNLRHMISILDDADVHVVLMTPNRPNSTFEQWRFDRTAQYVDVVRKLSMEFGVPLVDVWKENEAYASTPARSVDDLLLDSVHPNDAGHELVATLLAKVIARSAGRN